VPAGILAALRRDRALDVAVRVVSITGTSFPVFWLGIILQLVFFYGLSQLGLPSLPSRGRVAEEIALLHPVGPITGLFVADSLVSGNLPFFASAVRHLVLPAFTLSLISLAAVVRIMRASMLEVLRQNSSCSRDPRACRPGPLSCGTPSRTPSPRF
jgi:peptide/nickel transport system permease protein